MKEEIRRIMKLVQEGKLSPEDAAELIDAFTESDAAKEDKAKESEAPSEAEGDKKEPFKLFVDFMEGIGKEVTETVDWQQIARQVRSGTQKGMEQLKSGVEKLREGKINWSWFAAYENREVTLPLEVPKGKTLRIENPVGDVKVSGGHETGSVRATARVRGMDADEAHEKAEAYTLIVEESGNQVLIRQPDVSGLSVDLDVQLAAKSAVEIRTISGNAQIAGTNGSARVDTQSGNVKLKGLNGTIEVHSQSGDLTLDESKTSAATLEVKSGDITLAKVKGNIVARSASGDVSLHDCGGKSVSVESVTGDVRADLSEPVAGTVSIRTVNGEASVTVTDGCDCRVSLSTLRGNVVCDLELEDEARHEQHVTGRLGEGTGTLDVSGVNGNIALRLRSHEVKED
jgi:hypothetical protein